MSLLLVVVFICVVYVNVILGYVVFINVVYLKLVILSFNFLNGSFLGLNVVNGFLFDLVYILLEKLLWLRIDFGVRFFIYEIEVFVRFDCCGRYKVFFYICF